MTPADDEPVPRLPRGRGIKLDAAMMIRIGMTLALLVMVVLTARPCANAASSFVTGFGDEGSASSTMPKPGNVDVPARGADHYEQISPSATPEEVEAAIARARAKAAAREQATPGEPAPAAGAGSAGDPAPAAGAGDPAPAAGAGDPAPAAAGSAGGQGGSGGAERPSP